MIKQKKITFGFSLKLLLIGQALNVIMPAGTGDIAKSYFGYKEQGQKERMFSVSVFDKLLAIASVGLLGLYSAIASNNWYYLILVGVSIAPLLFVLLFKHLLKITLINKITQKLNSKIKRIDIYEVINNLSFSNITIFKSVLISLLAWILTYTLMYYCFGVFYINILLKDILIFSPILTLARLFPFTLSGIGSDEALIVYLFTLNSNTNISLLLLSALFYRLVLMIIPALPGLYYVIKTKSK